MPYRLHKDGTIECDTFEELEALINQPSIITPQAISKLDRQALIPVQIKTALLANYPHSEAKYIVLNQGNIV